MVFQVDPHVACVLIVVGILKDRTGALKRKRLPGYPNSTHTKQLFPNQNMDRPDTQMPPLRRPIYFIFCLTKPYQPVLYPS